MSSSLDAPPSTSPPRGVEEHTRSSSWFHRPLTVRDGVLFTGLLLPAAYLPYFLIRQRLNAITTELNSLQRASVGFANEMRAARAGLSGQKVSVSEQPTPSPPFNPSVVQSLQRQLSKLRELVERTTSRLDNTIITQRRRIAVMLFRARQDAFSRESEARKWRAATSERITGLYEEVGRDRCAAFMQC
ncbi:hypothetical protein K466DRAFT_287071 [Polyporus arcularius HHB13444]|uniref:Uncharacterized protein n=1 Tax=Polyporus arcularius HHB13444 TaxID=1314778 RepID=A0A5C3PQ14_9APHY|nr:hypothetical protein K466DRAFT_287071 [Polyporus arcularius HHB13444]